MIIVQLHSIYNNIGESGATSLSEALKVNSSLTQLDLGVSLLLNMIYCLLFKHFHLEQYWFIRSNIIIRSVESQFITHSIEPVFEFIIECDWLIIIESHSIWNNIGSSGATSLSEALKVNSSLTQLNLNVSLLLNMIDWLLLNHIPFWTRLENQEQRHYQRHWRSIHPSLTWNWEWVYYWIWLIDYCWITFHL